MAQTPARLIGAGLEFQGERFDTGVCFMSFPPTRTATR
jgi:hypothetical protein